MASREQGTVSLPTVYHLDDAGKVPWVHGVVFCVFLQPGQRTYGIKFKMAES